VKRRGACCLLAILGLSTGLARSDEFRMKDGERIFGVLLEETKGRYEVETAEGIRKIAVAEVETRIEGDAPHRHLAAARAKLQGDDRAGRLALMAYAWRHHLDDDARRLAEEILSLDPDAEAAHAILGHVRLADAWVQGWPAPFSAIGVTGPRWGTARKRAAARAGATATTERALQEGLAWLARHQDPDGRIDADQFMKHDPADDKCDGAGGGHHGERVPCAFDGVTTALAVMGWLGDGSTSRSGSYRANIERGLSYLRGVVAGSPRGFDAIWNHSFALAALADAYTVGRSPDLFPTLERGTAALLRTQGADGGWRYMSGQISGVPSTSAALFALGMACQAGVALPKAPIERAVRFLDARVDSGTGRSEYHEGAERLGYTPTVRNAASALTGRAFLGVLGKAPQRGKQVQALLARKPKWKIRFKKLEAPDGTVREFQIGTLDPYCWYYTTLALRQIGGSAWRSWSGPLKSALLEGQRKNGSAKGSWDPLGNYSSSGGRAFVTGMCCLMLQAPYRFPDK
jgi:hypothetical protein